MPFESNWQRGTDADMKQVQLPIILQVASMVFKRSNQLHPSLLFIIHKGVLLTNCSGIVMFLPGSSLKGRGPKLTVESE